MKNKYIRWMSGVAGIALSAISLYGISNQHNSSNSEDMIGVSKDIIIEEENSTLEGVVLENQTERFFDDSEPEPYIA
ncbi:MAG: hypothetical protein ACLFTR_05855, partial [Candidatus Woesearchaeota archaeon]